MPSHNLSNDHYTRAEMDQAKNLLAQFRDLIKTRTRNLLPDERQRYGSIREQTKLLVQKDLSYHEHQPHLDCSDVDWKELEADYADRVFLEMLITGGAELKQMADNARILHDYDCYQSVLVDYHYTKFKAENSEEAGWETKYNDLKQFFPNTGGSGDDGPSKGE